MVGTVVTRRDWTQEASVSAVTKRRPVTQTIARVVLPDIGDKATRYGGPTFDCIHFYPERAWCR